MRRERKRKKKRKSDKTKIMMNEKKHNIKKKITSTKDRIFS